MKSGKKHQTSLTANLLDSNTFEEMTQIDQTNFYQLDRISSSSAQCKLITILCLNTIVFLTELIISFSIKSLSLQSDSLNKLFNELAIIVGLVSFELSKRQQSDKMSFGWARMETFGGLCNSVLLMSLCLTNFCDSIECFMNVRKIDHPLVFIIVGIVCFVINIINMIILNDY